MNRLLNENPKNKRLGNFRGFLGKDKNAQRIGYMSLSGDLLSISHNLSAFVRYP